MPDDLQVEWEYEKVEKVVFASALYAQNANE